jgi:hypothetical protein
MNSTIALTNFKKTMGSTNLFVNTLIIGLESVKNKTITKPNDLTIGWQLPKNPEILAAQSRSFVTRATLVCLVDAIDQYLHSLGKTPGYINDRELAAFLQGEKAEIPDKHTKTGKITSKVRRPKISERLEKIENIFNIVEPKSYMALMHLLFCWRNNVTHSNSRDNIEPTKEQLLKADKDYFKNNHSNINIIETIKHFKSGDLPTLKDLSTMIAVSHRVLNAIDAAVIIQTNQNSLVGYLLSNSLSKLSKSEITKIYTRDHNKKLLTLFRILNISGYINVNAKNSEVFNEFLNADSNTVENIILKYNS